MIRNVFVATLLLFIVGCTSPQSDQLTQQQKDQIKLEIKAACDSMVAIWNRADTSRYMQYYADSPDWVCFNLDGSRSDYQALKKSWLDAANSIIDYKWTTTHQDFAFISKDVVLCAWEGNSAMIGRQSGKQLTFDPIAYTAVFKKIAGRWQVVYSHTSATSVTEKADKK